jgi:gamma-glutamylcyclotransferase (GGCT)/AIG2-like uncharacterized protein YtfP
LSGTSDPRSERIFLYGTLRRGGGADHLLRGCTPLGPATVRGRLYDLGTYPALVLDPAGHPVHGEVWECPAQLVGELDRYEGTAVGLFERVEVAIRRKPCQVYVAGPALRPRLHEATPLAGGRWPVSGDV